MIVATAEKKYNNENDSRNTYSHKKDCKNLK